jgi:hypothetical protein
MKGFKQCEKGHFYKEELDSCNYCPKSGQTSSQIGTGDKTQLFNNTSADGDRTVVVGPGGGTGQSQSDSGTKRDPTRTIIQGVTDDGSKDVITNSQPTRKIVGWIISYTLDPMGADYRIYEGQNTIGRDIKNSVVIMKDQGVSGTHITILCKKGQFLLKDEMASNGTFINGTEIEIGKPHELKDGDEIRLGATTTFTFKSAV